MPKSTKWIDGLSAPAMITWQLTRDCNLACLHCCTDSAPGRALKDELSREEALRLADQIIHAGVPKVMLCGGEPTLVPHFMEIAEKLGRADIFLKIETNGQNFKPIHTQKLAGLPIFSIQISLDGETQETYSKQRPGGNLKAVHDACRAVVAAGMPLEITFAPTQINIHEAEAVINRAASLRAFRFNTGMLMRVGTAAKLWGRLELPPQEYAKCFELLRRKQSQMEGRMELCFEPWSLAEELKTQGQRPPATMLVLPHGKVKVSAALPHLCADLKRQDLAEAWAAYRSAWDSPQIIAAVEGVAADMDRLSQANSWIDLASPDMAPAEAHYSSFARALPVRA